MAYEDIYAATGADPAKPRLIKQIAVAVSKAATDVLNEDDATAKHSDRLTWARRVKLSGGGVSAPVTMAESMVWEVLANATIQAAPSAATDSDVQFVVNSLIDKFARGI